MTLKSLKNGQKKQIMGSIQSVGNRILRMTQGQPTPSVDMVEFFSTLYLKQDGNWTVQGYICKYCNQIAGNSKEIAKRHLLICKSGPFDI
jgi:hypothetical protein